MGIESLLRPSSIAIVGASEKVGPGYNAFKALEFVGYEGDVHLVNPRSKEVFGRPAHASLDSVPGEIDAVFVAVQAETVIEVARQAARRGAGALAILSSGFGETQDGVSAQRTLIEIAEAGRMAVCGPNCLGLLNFVGKSALFGTSLPEKVARGGVAAIVQSGSIGIALLNSARGIGFSHIITTGNEAVTSAADYIDALADDPDVTTILVFSEQIKKPMEFVRALRHAREAGKPVVVLKSGRSRSGKAAVMAHTGAIAGSDEACDAALLAAGAIQVQSLDELIETTLLASKASLRPTTKKLGGLSISGGEVALALDASEDLGLSFAPLGVATEPVKKLLPPFAHLSNPLDLTWAGIYDSSVATGCAEAIASQDDVGMLVLLQDAPGGLGSQQAERYSKLLEAVAAGAKRANKPFLALSNLSDQPHATLQAMADKVDIPYLRGTRVGLSAITHYVKWSVAGLKKAEERKPEERKAANEAFDRIPKHRLPAEHEAREALKGYGVVGPRDQLVSDLDGTIAAAKDLGYPVVLKGIVEGMIHKSDAGLVKVGLRSDADITRAVASMKTSLTAFSPEKFLGFLVQQQIASIGEIFIGARTDPEFGPLVVVGAGGVQVELYKDVAIRLAPIDEVEAAEMLSSTKVSKLFAGFRGNPLGDIRSVARTVSAVSRFIADFSDKISEMEINPLAVLEDGRGCMALDCVLIPKGRETIDSEKMMFDRTNNDTGRAGAVYREIKRRITELVYKPGDKISEARLAEELGCGRSPVRTALSRLQSEGWTEISPSSGTFVKGLSPGEITEILEARLLLEVYLAGRAAKMMSNEELVRLRRAFNAFGQSVEVDHMDEYLELDLQLHMSIYKAAANKILSDVLLNLIDKIRWLRRASAGYPVRIQEAFVEIHAVLDALEARDLEAAAAAMRVHIENTLEFRRLDQSWDEDMSSTTGPNIGKTSFMEL